MAHSYIRTGDDHAREIIGIARSVAGDIRDARIMNDFVRHMMFDGGESALRAERVAIRNYYVIAHAARIGVK